MFGGFGLFGSFFMIAFWALIIWAVVYFVRKISEDTNINNQQNNPINILKERYAKGEINKEEYEERKKDLSS